MIKTSRKRILVVGAHRSGTTLASYVLADELGYAWDTESRVKRDMQGKRERFNPDHVIDAMHAQPCIVMHGASCFDHLSRFVRRVNGLAVVFVWRNPADVRASQLNASSAVKDDPVQKFLEFVVSMRGCTDSRVEHHVMVYPDSLHHHPVWTENRGQWSQRQITSDGVTAYDAQGHYVRHD